MAKRKTRKKQRPKKTDESGCCTVESVIGIDERGQLVLPKGLREKAKVKAGDKMAVVSWAKGGEVCCIVMIKADGLTKMVSKMIGPVIKEVAEK